MAGVMMKLAVRAVTEFVSLLVLVFCYALAGLMGAGFVGGLAYAAYLAAT
jgi:hypothetical protein